MVLNMISTGTMIRCRRTYGNLMVALRAGSEKLKSRARQLVGVVTGSHEDVDALLESAGWDVRLACVMRQKGLGCEESRRLLERRQGSLRAALSD